MNSSLTNTKKKLAGFSQSAVCLVVAFMLSFYNGNNGYLLPLAAAGLWSIASLWLRLSLTTKDLALRWRSTTKSILAIPRFITWAIIIACGFAIVSSPEAKVSDSLARVSLFNTITVVAVLYHLTDVMFIRNRFVVAPGTIIQLGEIFLLPGDRFKVGPFLYPFYGVRVIEEYQELKPIQTKVQCKDGEIDELRVKLKISISVLERWRQEQKPVKFDLYSVLERERQLISIHLKGDWSNNHLAEVLNGIPLQEEVVNNCPVTLTELTPTLCFHSPPPNS